MNFAAAIEAFYSKISVICDSPVGKVTFVENYIPNLHVDRFADEILIEFSKRYQTDNCVTEIVKQPYGEDKIKPIVNFQLNSHTQSLKEEFYKRSNPWTIAQNSPLGSIVAKAGITVCGSVFVYQSLQAMVQIRRNKPSQALKHGLIAIFSVIMLLIFERTVLRM